MYKIIGGDGNEYGPVDSNQLRQWVQDGRAGAQTKVQAEGETEWKNLSEVPEFADLFPSSTATPGGPPPTIPGPAPVGGYGMEDPRQMVQGPAIGLIVTAVLGVLANLTGIALNILGVSMGASGMQGHGREEAWVNMMSGGVGIVTSIIGIAMGVVILLGALKMKNLENYTFAIIATVVAMVPCISPCCLVGLPIGIWALVILNKPEVKSAFH